MGREEGAYHALRAAGVSLSRRRIQGWMCVTFECGPACSEKRLIYVCMMYPLPLAPSPLLFVSPCQRRDRPTLPSPPSA